MYGSDLSEKYFLIEVVLSKATKRGQLIVKSNADKEIQIFIDYFLNTISSIITHSL